MSEPFHVTCPSCKHAFTFRRISPKRRAATPERFWSKVYCDPNTGCFYWYGALDGTGRYGCLSVPSDSQYRKGRVVGAHRYSYELAKGPIPDDMVVMHKCDNPRCVNPDHLELGTQTDNMRDCARKGRKWHKLTRELVLDIKTMWSTGSSVKRICARLDIPRGTVQAIVEGRTWQHVDVPGGYAVARQKIVVRGETSGMSKTTEDVVRAIRVAHADGANLDELMARFGMSRAQTWKIVKRVAWAHVS